MTLRLSIIAIFLIFVCCFTISVQPAFAAEMKKADGVRRKILVEKYENNQLTVYHTSGDKETLPLIDIANIYYSGRNDRFIRTGEQRFHFNAGGSVCAAVGKLVDGEVLTIRSQSLGELMIPIKYLHGFTSISLEGRISRIAEDLLDDAMLTGEENRFMDHFLDRRGVPYAGVLESFTATNIEFEHDEQMQSVRIGTYKLAGTRLAEAAKLKQDPIDPINTIHVGIRCRDRSYVVGRLLHVNPFEWIISPSWNETQKLNVPTNEITYVDIMGGRVIFLTHLTPIKHDESTLISPPQPFQINRNSRGEPLDIGGFIYQNGIGVHAASKLTYQLDGMFKIFSADVGIDGRMETEGSVVFSVFGDGKLLHKTKLIRGKLFGGGVKLSVPIEGVRELMLVTDPTGDMDQGDLSNWGAARVLR